MTEKKITNLRIKLRIQETAHLRAFVSGDSTKAAAHREKIKELKSELAKLYEVAA
jgi:hypothetical protein